MLYLDDEKAVKSDAFSTAVHFWFDTVLFILLASVFYFFLWILAWFSVELNRGYYVNGM